MMAKGFLGAQEKEPTQHKKKHPQTNPPKKTKKKKANTKHTHQGPKRIKDSPEGATGGGTRLQLPRCGMTKSAEK